MKAVYSKAFVEQALVKIFSRDDRTVVSVANELNMNDYPSFVICMKDIPELLTRHGMAIVQKDALDGLTRLTRFTRQPRNPLTPAAWAHLSRLKDM